MSVTTYRNLKVLAELHSPNEVLMPRAYSLIRSIDRVASVMTYMLCFSLFVEKSIQNYNTTNARDPDGSTATL